MPIVTPLGLAPADDALDVEKHYTPTFGEYLKAVWDDTANDDPMTLVANLRREQEARYGVDVYTVAEEGGLTGGLEALRETAPLPAMPLEEQKAYINKEGLAGQLAPGEHYTPEELEFLARLKHEELDRKLTREQAPGWMAPFGFAAGLAESMTDPLNLATSFVPVVGEARVMSLLGKTGSAWGRAGVRAGVGAIEGAVGAALVEPVVAGAKSALQQDYGFADSLMNVAFGAGMGAALHPLTGAFGDFTRARKGQRQPWEYVPSTDTTEQLRAGNAQSIWRGMQESGSEHLSPEHAEAAAALWDATLRGYAYDTGELVEDLYRHYRVEYRGGKLEVLPTAAEADGRTARLAEMFKDMTDTTERTSVPDGDEDEAEPAAPDAPEAVAADAAADGRAVEEAGAVDGMAPEEAVVSPAAPVAPVGEEGAGVSRRALGLPTSILNGQTAEGARYELREMSDLIPSHDPERQFAKRNDYPEGVQERPYHSDSGEQEKVLRNAAGLDPRYLLNDNPDAINGPPLVTDSGVVLGGNSRTMSIQLAYSNFPERAAGYRDALRQRASLFGIDPAAVDAFERPVLVRVVEGGDNANDMAVRARLYNQSQTQGLQAQAEGVSKARLLSAESMDILAADMEGFDSLREFFSAAKSKDFISALSRDGVLEHTQLSRLTDSSGKLNDAGKDLVENALRGLVVPDYDVLHATPPSVLHKLDRAIPALARLKARGEDWDMSGVVTRALRAVAAAEAEGKDISIYLGQGGLLQGGPKPAVQALALTFSKATQKEVQARFTVLADASERQNRGQTSLLVQEDNTPAREFVRAFLQPVAAVDGELFPGFAPGKNVTHEAIAYAYEHGGKTHSVAVAVEDLQKKLSSATASAEEKTRARALMGELAHLSGTVNIYEPRLGNFFSYKKGDALFQSAPSSPENGGTVITVRGDELGVPEGADIQEYIKAAKKYHDQLKYESEHGKPVVQPQLDKPVRFSRKGWGKNRFGGADTQKWQLFPYLRQLIETSKLVRTDKSIGKPGFEKVHWLENSVLLDGKLLQIGFTLLEDVNGNLFYNLAADTGKTSKTKALYSLKPVARKPGHKELFQDASASIENTITTSTDGVNLYILSEGAQGEAPRARVSFGEKDAYAVVEFFKAADPSSAPHEMYHIFRRIMSELYDDPRASEASKERYRKACEFVGAEPGKVWTPEQEEKFARAGERFLLEGVAPNARMHDVMEAFRQWMGEIYGNAERSGLEISDGMRKVFGDMLGTAEDGDLNFRYAMGQILDYHPERGIDTTFEAPAYSTPEQALEAYTADASARMDEAFNALADKPEVQERFRQEYAAALADADAVIADARTMAQIRQAAAACVMRG